MQPLRPRMSFKMVLLVIRQQGISLCRHSLQLALTGSLGLRTLGVHLILKGLLTLLLGLGTVNLKRDLLEQHFSHEASPKSDKKR